MNFKFNIYMTLPFEEESLDSFDLEGEDGQGFTVIVTIPDLLKVNYYYQDPEKPNQTIISIGDLKISIPMKKRIFETLLETVERHHLYSTLTLN